MPDTAMTNSRIVAAYRERTPGSERLAAEATSVLPSGIAHDSRYLRPYGFYIERAAGAHKWDVDGNEYVDYFGGHGALLLGHGHPKVLAAAQEALAHGTHFGANHPAELRWAKMVQQLVPSAERVRFTASGTEATHMALRLARAFTGKHKMIRFKTHFHGWHDHMTSGYASHFDGSPTPGVLPGIAGSVALLPPGDVDALRAALEADDDIAAAFVEPTGGSFGMVPMQPAFLTALRELTAKHGVVLVFDEVISGFRVSPGGAQARFGVLPDLTTMAKILAGGLPGGAVAGRKEILDMLDFQAAEQSGREKIAHPGTFNANPVSAAAGAAALEVVGSTDACARAHALCDALKVRLNETLEAAQVPWAVYGTFAGFHIFMNPKRRALRPSDFDPFEIPFEEIKTKNGPLVHRLRLAMAINGVDLCSWPGGWTSTQHSEEDIERTAEAFAESLRMLKREGEL